MSVAEIDNAIKNAAAAYRKAEGIDDLVAPFKAARDVLNETTEKLKQARDMGAVSAEEYARGMRRATDAYKKSGISELNIGDLLKEKLSPFDQLADDQRRLSEALGKGAITSAEYAVGVKNATAKMKAASDVSRYFDASDTLTGRQAALAEVYANLEKQAAALNLTGKQLDVAKRKAAKNYQEQSEMGRLMLEAQEKLKPVTEKLAETYAKIDAEAVVWGWSTEIVEKMKELAREKIVGTSEPGGRTHDNQALVRGSVAYVDFLRRGAGNDHMKKIRENTARQNELLAQNVETTKTVASVLNQKIEIVN